jgi:hypothetical protein
LDLHADLDLELIKLWRCHAAAYLWKKLRPNALQEKKGEIRMMLIFVELFSLARPHASQ